MRWGMLLSIHAMIRWPIAACHLDIDCYGLHLHAYKCLLMMRSNHALMIVGVLIHPIT